MFYKKKGKPNIGDLVVCTVKKILYHSVFVSIDEYEALEGMIHISEIAPGRIRNLRDHVIEGKKIVCAVLNINQQGQIDISLRRASMNARLNKLKEYQNDEKAERLIDQVCKEFKTNLAKFYKSTGENIIEKYGGLYTFFQAVVENGKEAIDELGPDSKFNEALLNTIKEKIKSVEVSISGTLNLRSYNGSGVEDIKNILLKLIDNKIDVNYLGAPRYKLRVIDKNYKDAENILRKGIELASNYAEELGCEFNFVKDG